MSTPGQAILYHTGSFCRWAVLSAGHRDVSVDQQSSPGKPANNILFSLYLAMMAVGMGQTVVFAVIPMLGREMGLDHLVFELPLIGLRVEPRELAITSLSAMAAVVFFFAAPFWGRLSDRLGRKPVILMGLLGYALGSSVFNLASYVGLTGLLSGIALYLLLALTRCFHALVMSGTHPGAAAYMVDVTSVSERTKGMGRLQAANQLGVMIGPVLAWFVHISFLAPLFVQAALALGAALLVWRYLPSTPLPPDSGERRRRMSYFDPRYRLFIFVGFTVFSLVAMVQQTLGFYFQDTLGVDGVRAAQLFSAAMVVSSAAMLATQLLLVQRLRLPPLTLLVGGMPFTLLAYVTLANADQLSHLLLGMALVGVGMGLTGPAFTASATLVVEPKEQGELAGMLGSIIGLGFVFGPLLGGALYRLSSSYPYWAAGLIMLLMTLLLSWHWRARLFLSRRDAV